MDPRGRIVVSTGNGGCLGVVTGERGLVWVVCGLRSSVSHLGGSEGAPVYRNKLSVSLFGRVRGGGPSPPHLDMHTIRLVPREAPHRPTPIDNFIHIVDGREGTEVLLLNGAVACFDSLFVLRNRPTFCSPPAGYELVLCHRSSVSVTHVDLNQILGVLVSIG